MRIRDGKKVVHDGIKVEFVGSIGVSRCHEFFCAYLTSSSRALL